MLLIQELRLLKQGERLNSTPLKQRVADIKLWNEQVENSEGQKGGGKVNQLDQTTGVC